MTFSQLHRWPRSAAMAIRLQALLASRVRLDPITTSPRLLAGVDAAFSPDGGTVIAAVIVWRCADAAVVETAIARRACRFPYVPGLLSFRELPAVLAAFRRIRSSPDAVLCDAQGIAHPRRFGLACHLGLWLDLPTIGCAKSRLCGTHAEPGAMRGANTPLIHHGDPVGAVLRTRDYVRPLFVSPGHRCDLTAAMRITLAACRGFRLPEPTRLAHAAGSRERARPTPASRRERGRRARSTDSPVHSRA